MDRSARVFSKQEALSPGSRSLPEAMFTDGTLTGSCLGAVSLELEKGTGHGYSKNHLHLMHSPSGRFTLLITSSPASMGISLSFSAIAGGLSERDCGPEHSEWSGTECVQGIQLQRQVSPAPPT